MSRVDIDTSKNTSSWMVKFKKQFSQNGVESKAKKLTVNYH